MLKVQKQWRREKLLMQEKWEGTLIMSFLSEIGSYIVSQECTWRRKYWKFDEKRDNMNMFPGITRGQEKMVWLSGRIKTPGT